MSLCPSRRFKFLSIKHTSGTPKRFSVFRYLSNTEFLTGFFFAFTLLRTCFLSVKLYVTLTTLRLPVRNLRRTTDCVRIGCNSYLFFIRFYRQNNVGDRGVMCTHNVQYQMRLPVKCSRA